MKTSIKLRLAAVASGLALSGASAMAALPTEVDTAIADMKADGVTLAAAFLVVCIAIAAVKILRRGA